MQDLKFRAWDKKNNRIFYPNSLMNFTNPHKCTYAVQHHKDGSLTSSYDCILMQWTGLFDKNGVEIYEGDIVIEPFWWWGCGRVVLDEKYNGQLLRWVIEMADGSKIYNYWEFDKIKVIGNRYENPEL